MEIYRALADFPGYSVSNLGKVRKDKNQAILSPFYQDGYPRVNIWKGRKRTKVFIHVLVAMAFVPRGRPDQTQVNHKNSQRDDCRAVNLEYVSPWENIAHVRWSKFFKWDDDGPSPQHENVTCPYCLHEFAGDTCERCSCRQSTPRDNWHRSGGLFS